MHTGRSEPKHGPCAGARILRDYGIYPHRTWKPDKNFHAIRDWWVEDYARFVQAAMDVANSKTEIQDPCGADDFLSGWMTVGSSPGDDSVAFQAIMDNQFFMMKRKK